MNKEQLPFWLALLRAPQVGHKTFANILRHFPNLEEFFKQNSTTQQNLGCHPETIDYLKNPDWRGVETDLNWQSSSSNNSIITFLDPLYPKLLKEISSPPPILFAKGDLHLLNSPQIAIVGSRKPTPKGREIASELAQDLGKAGLAITSGLALGIDTAAHEGALLENGTIAVIGTGINIQYPKINQSLADKIVQKGAIVSEFCIDTPPTAHNFPRRNRIISGLSLGTLVVEANLKSGSLITTSCALEQGREIFAVPGSIHNPRTRGCHLLIKQGAKLVESVSDILEELLMFQAKSLYKPHKTAGLKHKRLDDDHIKLLECIDYEVTKIDILVERSSFSIQKITSILVDLELEGFITSTVGGYLRASE